MIHVDRKRKVENLRLVQRVRFMVDNHGWVQLKVVGRIF